MEYITIQGGVKLKGSVKVSGSKKLCTSNISKFIAY
jgi:UDP-N-acetylglucosamine enolpyruvyl transferase